MTTRRSFVAAALASSLVPFESALAQAAQGARRAMTGVTAINLLITPDATMLERASEANARCRENFPDGFALDAQHPPHLTTLQRYVRAADLDGVFAAAGEVIRSHDLSRLELKAVRYAHLPLATLPGVGLAAMVVAPSPDLVKLQGALVEAIAPFVEPGGTAAAYVTTPQEPDINEDTLRYVERYVPDHSGPKYIGHVTVGLAKLDYLVALEAKPFDAFVFHPAAFAVFKLGNNGTARLALKTWKVG